MESFYQAQLTIYQEFLRNRFQGNVVALVLIEGIIQRLRELESHFKFNRIWCMRNLGCYFTALVDLQKFAKINGEFSFGYFKAKGVCERFRDNLKSVCPNFSDSSLHIYCEEVIATEERLEAFHEIMRQISMFPI